MKVIMQKIDEDGIERYGAAVFDNRRLVRGMARYRLVLLDITAWTLDVFRLNNAITRGHYNVEVLR
jgi:hypothetical protein